MSVPMMVMMMALFCRTPQQSSPSIFEQNDENSHKEQLSCFTVEITISRQPKETDTETLAILVNLFVFVVLMLLVDELIS